MSGKCAPPRLHFRPISWATKDRAPPRTSSVSGKITCQRAARRSLNRQGRRRGRCCGGGRRQRQSVGGRRRRRRRVAVPPLKKVVWAGGGGAAAGRARRRRRGASRAQSAVARRGVMTETTHVRLHNAP